MSQRHRYARQARAPAAGLAERAALGVNNADVRMCVLTVRSMTALRRGLDRPLRRGWGAYFLLKHEQWWWAASAALERAAGQRERRWRRRRRLAHRIAAAAHACAEAQSGGIARDCGARSMLLRAHVMTGMASHRAAAIACSVGPVVSRSSSRGVLSGRPEVCTA